MAGRHEYRANDERVRRTVRVFEQDGLKLRRIVIDADPLGDLAIETGITARAFTDNMNRPEGPSVAPQALQVSLTSVPLN
jgi:hypothetical protein